jgi:hypothetical protein
VHAGGGLPLAAFVACLVAYGHFVHFLWEWLAVQPLAQVRLLLSGLAVVLV